jgi:hypothetical protein
VGSTQPPIQWVPGSVYPGVKQPRREADHSPPTSAEIKKTWVYTSTPPQVFMAQCLISYVQVQIYVTLQWRIIDTYERILRITSRSLVSLLSATPRIRDNDITIELVSPDSTPRLVTLFDVSNLDCMQNVVSLADLQLPFAGITILQSMSVALFKLSCNAEDNDTSIKRFTIPEVKPLEFYVPEDVSLQFCSIYRTKSACFFNYIRFHSKIALRSVGSALSYTSLCEAYWNFCK